MGFQFFYVEKDLRHCYSDLYFLFVDILRIDGDRGGDRVKFENWIFLKNAVFLE